MIAPVNEPLVVLPKRRLFPKLVTVAVPGLTPVPLSVIVLLAVRMIATDPPVTAMPVPVMLLIVMLLMKPITPVVAGGTLTKIPSGLPAIATSSMLKTIPAPGFPVVSTLNAVPALFEITTFLRVTRAEPEPVAWTRMPPPVAPLPLSAIVVSVTVTLTTVLGAIWMPVPLLAR